MQDELARTEVQGGKQLVLSFDAGCLTCSDLASRIEDRVGDKLDIRNLNDPEVQDWRRKVFGEDAKWAPTLFQIEEGRVQAWAGWRMGWALNRAIGLAATWRVMQALGEVGVAPKVAESPIVNKLPERAAEAVVGMSRGRFLKRLSSAAVAASVLSGTDLMIASADAATRNPEAVVGGRRVTGPELTRLARQAALSRDARKVAGGALNTTREIDAAKPVAVLYRLKNGNTLLALAFTLPRGRVVLYLKYGRRPRKGGRTQSRVFYVQGKRATLVNATDGGIQWRRPKSARTSSEAASRTPYGYPLSECPPIGSVDGSHPGNIYDPHSGCDIVNVCGDPNQTCYPTKVCVDHDWTSISSCGGVLVGAAIGGGAGALVGGIPCAVNPLEGKWFCDKWRTVYRPCRWYDCG